MSAPGHAAGARVSAALIAKHRTVHDLVRVSCDARDLFAAKDEIARGAFRDVDPRILSAISTALTSVSERPDALADLLIAASQGIANANPSFSESERGITWLVSALVVSEGRDDR